MDVKNKNSNITRPRMVGTVKNNIGPSLLDPGAVRNIINGNDFKKKSEIWDHLLTNDTHIRAAWSQRMAAQQRINWTVAGAPSPYIDILQNFISKYSNDLAQIIMDARGRGITVMMVTWSDIDGVIAPISVQPISPYVLSITWDSSKYCYVIGYESVTGDIVDIVTQPDSIYTVIDTAVMLPPHQRGMWAPLAWMYAQKRKALRDWQIASSKVGVPITVITKPENTSDDIDAQMIDAADAIDTRSSIVLPYGTQVSISDGVSRGDVTSMFLSQIAYCDVEITLAILGQSASMLGTPGALGAESIRDAVRIDIIDADTLFIQHYINQILTSFAKLNDISVPVLTIS